LKKGEHTKVKCSSGGHWRCPFSIWGGGCIEDKKGKPRKEKNFQEVVKEFDKYFHDPEQFYKIFSELGFSYVDDGCDGACDHC
jgi:hypothetical protein